MTSIGEFLGVVHGIHAFFMDAHAGLGVMVKQVEEAQAIRLASGQAEFQSQADVDRLRFIYFDTDPNKPAARRLHVSTQGDFRRRNTKGGRNHTYLGNLCLVAIYSFWESHYRPAIAKHLGREPSDLKFSVMGDIRLLRESIVHHHGTAIKEVARCEVLQWFKPGDLIQIDEVQFDTIISEVRSAIEALEFHK